MQSTIIKTKTYLVKITDLFDYKVFETDIVAENRKDAINKAIEIYSELLDTDETGLEVEVIYCR
jgi:hypothetical protein